MFFWILEAPQFLFLQPWFQHLPCPSAGNIGNRCGCNSSNEGVVFNMVGNFWGKLDVAALLDRSREYCRFVTGVLRHLWQVSDTYEHDHHDFTVCFRSSKIFSVAGHTGRWCDCGSPNAGVVSTWLAKALLQNPFCILYLERCRFVGGCCAIYCIY